MTAAVQPAYVCDEAEARDLTDRIKASVDKTWQLLLNAREWNAWSSLGYGTWEAYVREEFGIGRSRSYQLLDQARVVREIEAAASTSVDITEAAARDLKAHLPRGSRARRRPARGWHHAVPARPRDAGRARRLGACRGWCLASDRQGGPDR